MSEEKRIILNGKKLTEAEFISEKERIDNAKDIKLIKVSENTYKTQLLG